MHKIISISLFLLFLSFTGKVWSEPDASSTEVLISNFTLPDLSGKQQQLKQWRGQVLVVNFWATWCRPCLAEIPEFIDLQKSRGQQGLQFIGVAVDTLASVQAFVETQQVNYPILIAGDNGIQMTLALGNHTGGLPFTLIIDREGQIQHRHFGKLSKQQVLVLVQSLL